MPTPLISPLVGTSLQLTLELLRIARELKQLSQKDWEEFKKQMDKEFSEIPTSDELRKKL